MKFLIPVLLFSLVPRCQTAAPIPPPSDVASAPALGEAQADRQSKAAAAVAAATVANQANPPSPAQAATAGELGVAAANLPSPAAVDRIEAHARVDAALHGRLSEAEAKWAEARDSAASLAARVAALDAQVISERKAAAHELQRQLAEARDDERRKAREFQLRTLSWLFYGLGAVLIGGGALMFLLGAQIPFVGPKAALAVGATGALLVACGIGVHELLQHRWMIWIGMGLAAATLATAAGLMISNHHHANSGGSHES